MSLHLHSSTRRPEPLKDTDYDHVISLIDHTKKPSPIRREATGLSIEVAAPTSDIDSDSSSRRHSSVPLHKSDSKHHPTHKLRKEISKRKYRKYQDRGGQGNKVDVEAGADEVDDSTDEQDGEDEGAAEPVQRGRPKSREQKQKEAESAIDVLYENQRGLFLCGIALFSASALGNLDPAPWTNIAHKTSATSTTNAQVPDPSWEWAWKDWSVNHENDVDEDGWEYSFAFSNKFSWHGRSWWKSFVRRRAWIRKRVKKHSGYQTQPLAHRLNSDYFTIYPAANRSRSRASTNTDADARRFSIDRLSKRDMEEVVQEDICDITALMAVLKTASIDREKLEAIENFIINGGDDLYYLRERMHDIMHMFVFQASRKILLGHLHQMYNAAAAQKDQVDGTGDGDDKIESPRKRRLANLSAGLEHADEEVKKLEYWSDVKEMTERGETKGAVDDSKGWDPKRWEGIDDSGPKDVLSKAEIAGDIKEPRANGKNGASVWSNGKSNGNTKGKDKGKGKETAIE
ncbi:hypothetical protein BJ875DRAFT_475436 [Amylocarpus encephaloides]|uniref:Peroxin/Ferlin domain-containing protein n=1 Tax=Amylocarpus encephaloides TaxID=45428 RepID=A0A9P8C0U0_9HELO|nr:hypothetical protein BJ875DRAFT_475436 [Amylocarpus encephaloides]